MVVDTPFEWIISLIGAFLCTISFSVIFHAPKRQLFFAGLVGTLGWLVYLIFMSFDSGVVMASFASACCLTCLARILSFVRQEPVTTYLMSGIFPIVPGADIYYTGYYLFMGNNTLGGEKFLETLKIAIAIALGIGIVLSLPYFLFSFKRIPNTHPSMHTSGKDETGGKR